MMKSSKQVSLIPKQCYLMLIKKKKKTDASIYLNPFNILLFPECMNREETKRNKNIFTAHTHKMQGL